MSLISICDAAANACYITFPPTGSGSGACYTQAIFISFFLAASVNWSMVILLTIYATILGALGRNTWFLRLCLDRPRIIHAVVWTFSLAQALLPLSTNSTGYSAGPVCWLSSDTTWGKFWVYFEYGVVWFVIGVVVLISYRVRYIVFAVVSIVVELNFKEQHITPRKERDVKDGYAKLLTFYNTLKWYPAILIVAFAPSASVRMAQINGYSENGIVRNGLKLVTSGLLQGISAISL